MRLHFKFFNMIEKPYAEWAPSTILLKYSIVAGENIITIYLPVNLLSVLVFFQMLGIHEIEMREVCGKNRHDDVIKWKHFPRYWPCVGGIHRSPVNSPHKGQWRGALMFSLIRVWINDWVDNHEAGDLRRHRGHYDVNVMKTIFKRIGCRILSIGHIKSAVLFIPTNMICIDVIIDISFVCHHILHYWISARLEVGLVSCHFRNNHSIVNCIMTPSNEHIFRVTIPLCRKIPVING